MRHLLLTSLLLSSALGLGACAGGYSGSFRSFKGHGAGRPVAASQVKTFADKASVGVAYTELGIAKGKAPTAQEAVEQAKFHCGQNGGNMLIMNTQPFQSGASWQADATCATDTAPATGGGAATNVNGTGKPAH